MFRCSRPLVFRALGVLALAVLATAAPAADALRERLIAQARACPPASLAFDRTTVITRISPFGRKTLTQVERWDGERWTLVSVDGRLPRDIEVRGAAKATAHLPVPGYYRLADLLAAAGDRRAGADGRVILQIPRLPAGTVNTGSDDISRHLGGEATIAEANGEPWVESLKITAREPFKLGMLITVGRFDQTFEYRLDGSGKPRLTTQVADSLGQMFGQSGGEKSEARYAYR